MHPRLLGRHPLRRGRDGVFRDTLADDRSWAHRGQRRNRRTGCRAGPNPDRDAGDRAGTGAAGSADQSPVADVAASAPSHSVRHSQSLPVPGPASASAAAASTPQRGATLHGRWRPTRALLSARDTRMPASRWARGRSERPRAPRLLLADRQTDRRGVLTRRHTSPRHSTSRSHDRTSGQSERRVVRYRRDHPAMAVRAGGGDAGAATARRTSSTKRSSASTSRAVERGDVVGIGIHTANAYRGYQLGRLARERGAVRGVRRHPRDAVSRTKCASTAVRMRS